MQTFTSGLQERAVRPGTLCLPLAVLTNALAVVLISGMVFSVYRDPAAQVSGLPQPGLGNLVARALFTTGAGIKAGKRLDY